MPISRHGLNRMVKHGVLAKATFEETLETLFEAAAFGYTDPLLGVSENTMIGRQAKMGTNLSQHVAPFKYILQSPRSTQHSPSRGPSTDLEDGTFRGGSSHTPSHVLGRELDAKPAHQATPSQHQALTDIVHLELGTWKPGTRTTLQLVLVHESLAIKVQSFRIAQGLLRDVNQVRWGSPPGATYAVDSDEWWCAHVDHCEQLRSKRAKRDDPVVAHTRATDDNTSEVFVFAYVCVAYNSLPWPRRPRGPHRGAHFLEPCHTYRTQYLKR
jgi:hypothetical protein